MMIARYRALTHEDSTDKIFADLFVEMMIARYRALTLTADVFCQERATA